MAHPWPDKVATISCQQVSSFIMSWSSASVGFWPKDRITVPNSFVVMVPSPSLSNKEKASLNSAICSSVSWSAMAQEAWESRDFRVNRHTLSQETRSRYAFQLFPIHGLCMSVSFHGWAWTNHFGRVMWHAKHVNWQLDLCQCGAFLRATDHPRRTLFALAFQRCCRPGADGSKQNKSQKWYQMIHNFQVVTKSHSKFLDLRIFAAVLLLSIAWFGLWTRVVFFTISRAFGIGLSSSYITQTLFRQGLSFPAWEKTAGLAWTDDDPERCFSCRAQTQNSLATRHFYITWTASQQTHKLIYPVYLDCIFSSCLQDKRLLYPWQNIRDCPGIGLSAWEPRWWSTYKAASALNIPASLLQLRSKAPSWCVGIFQELLSLSNKTGQKILNPSGRCWLHRIVICRT